MRLDVDFAFVVGEDFGRFLQEVFVLRRLDVDLVGGFVGIDFEHIRHLRVVFLFDRIHRQCAFFAADGGVDIGFADCVVGGGLSVLYAQFENIEHGRGVGGEGGSGEKGNQVFFHGFHRVGLGLIGCVDYTVFRRHGVMMPSEAGFMQAAVIFLRCRGQSWLCVLGEWAGFR